jgi:hypothetical protein
MTPREKADELFWKYRPIIAGKQFVTGLVLMSEAKELTKQCALIAVDEIIKVCPYIRQKDWETLEQLNAANIYFVEYWNEVKQEIEKL